MRAGWVLPSFIEGSGGHRTIFQNIQCLVNHGYECDVYIENNGNIRTIDELRKMIDSFFGGCQCNYYLGYDLSKEYDVLFATAWFTAKIVRDYPHAKHKAYFIQDFEALFNPMGDGYLLACTSYCYGLSPITIGKWLANKMQTEYNTPAQYFDFCADHNIYHRLNHVKKENAICFIYQPDKPRRCSVIGIEALGIVKYLRPDITIYLYGSNIKGHVWFEHINLGIIPIEQCNELYNRCKIGLCISSSNPSRIPFEMMAAGLPVVDLYMDNNLYDMPEQGVSLAHYTPESIAQALLQIIDNPEKAKNMSDFGVQYMKDRTLEYGYEQFYKAIDKLLQNQTIAIKNINKIYTKEPIISDIVIQNLVKENAYKKAAISKKNLLNYFKRNYWLRKSKLIRKFWYIIKEFKYGKK